MTVILGTDFTQEIGSAFAGELLPMTLHRAAETISTTGSTTTTYVDHVCEGAPAKWRESSNVVRGYPAGTAKVLILQASLSVSPSLGDHFTIRGERRRIVDVEQDAGGATWSVWGARS